MPSTRLVYLRIAPCMLVVLSPIFVQIMHTKYYKILKELESFKIIIVAPTCFGLHKPLSGSSQPALRQSYNVDVRYIYRYLKLSLLWLHILFSLVKRVDRALCKFKIFSSSPHSRTPSTSVRP